MPAGRAARATSLLVIGALVAAAPRGARAQAASAPDAPPEVETVGFGERRVPPDRAIVMLFVESRAASAAAAAAANARAVAGVRDTLRRLGLDTAATTASYNVGPDYERPEPRAGVPQRRAYLARTSVRVQLAQLDQVGRAIDAGLARGASGVEGVFFEASTAEEVRRAALAEAAAAARRDAEALARALGGTLGPLLGVSTAGGGRVDTSRRMPISMGYGGAGAVMQSTSIVPNELVVTAGVVTRWRFVPAGR